MIETKQFYAKKKKDIYNIYEKGKGKNAGYAELFYMGYWFVDEDTLEPSIAFKNLVLSSCDLIELNDLCKKIEHDR